MTFPGFTPNLARHAQLASLAPVDAARALLRYDFGIDEESAICFALRQDPRITLGDDDLMDVFLDLTDEVDDDETELTDYITPEAFIDRLVAASHPRRSSR